MPDWQRPILFEGVALPETAIAIDHLGMYGNLPEMSEAASLWLWRFTICVGVPKSDQSENIIRHATETLDLANRFRDRLLKTIPAKFDGAFTEEMLDSWIAALRTINRIAATRSSCTWEAPLLPGEPLHAVPPGEVLKEISARLAKAIDEGVR